jgi:uncharacterized protein YcbK (DUF882 family)
MQLTKNFSLKEFACHDGSDTPKDVVLRLQKVAIQLQVLRDFLEKPININSGYRNEVYNASIGGVKNSQHVLGNASDISVKGLTPEEVKEALEMLISSGHILQGGIGIYNSFVHYDIGYNGKKRRWDNRS